MERLIASYIHNDHLLSVKDISAMLDFKEKHTLNHCLWVPVNAKPKVEFSIAHNKQKIFLKYFVTEKHIRAVETEINGRIWEDSCVEFFISFDDRVTYYNLEFNSIGTGLIGFGSSRNNRELLSKQLIEKVEVFAISSEEDNWKKWELTLSIPVEIFICHQIANLSDKSSKVNFYKCGDLLPEPHFLAWNKIESSELNFHLPEFFGELRFE